MIEYLIYIYFISCVLCGLWAWIDVSAKQTIRLGHLVERIVISFMPFLNSAMLVMFVFMYIEDMEIWNKEIKL